MDNKPLLLEIGVEEIPARFIPYSLNALSEITSRTLTERGLGFSNIKTYATPRRIAVYVEGLPECQKDIIKEMFGPPVKASFDEQGNPTKAAEGFARSLGISADKLQRAYKGKAEYVVARVELKGHGTVEVLPEILKHIISSLNFPKSMRWGAGTFRFARPIQWIAAVYGNISIKFEIDGMESSNVTRGHRFLSPEPVILKDARQYEDLLIEKSVIADKQKRMESVKFQAEALCKGNGAQLAQDDELLSIVSDLVEYPVAVMCDFDSSYLELPEELLTAVMRGHQKYFSVKDPSGRLTNRFIVVSNTSIDNSDTVRAGAQRVIRARFEDARFYFIEDKAIKLTDRLQGLKNVLFQEGLGSTFDKTERLQKVSGAIADIICPEKKNSILEAAMLSKTDLITGVVKEFPELQGIMGMYYALAEGIDSTSANAIRQQYLPAYSGGALPDSDEGALLSLADKIDNICAFFSIGLKPTGSEDPFALRRQSLGAISILIDKSYDISLRGLIDITMANLAHLKSSGEVMQEICRFIEQRAENLLTSKGYASDAVSAVLKHVVDKPFKQTISCLDALESFSKEDGYNEFLLAMKRVRNISQGASTVSIREDLLTLSEEKDLYSALNSSMTAKTLADKGRYSEALIEIKRLSSPINKFFDKVLVMDKDPEVKHNRLSLLCEVWALAGLIADFSKLQERA